MTIIIFNRRKGVFGEQLVRITENIIPRPISSRQRTGRAFFIDTFEDYQAVITEQWSQNAGTISLDTANWRSPKTAMKLLTGAVDTNNCRANLYIALSKAGRYGMEAQINLNQVGTAVQEIDFDIWMHLGGQVSKARIKLLMEALNKFQYYSAVTSTYVDIPDGAFVHPASAGYVNYMNWKLIVDFVKLEYVKLMVGNKEWDLSGLGIITSGTPTEDSIQYGIEITTGEAVAKSMNVDDVIFTDRE